MIKKLIALGMLCFSVNMAYAEVLDLQGEVADEAEELAFKAGFVTKLAEQCNVMPENIAAAKKVMNKMTEGVMHLYFDDMYEAGALEAHLLIKKNKSCDLPSEMLQEYSDWVKVSEQSMVDIENKAKKNPVFESTSKILINLTFTSIQVQAVNDTGRCGVNHYLASNEKWISQSMKEVVRVSKLMNIKEEVVESMFKEQLKAALFEMSKQTDKDLCENVRIQKIQQRWPAFAEYQIGVLKKRFP